MALSPMQRRSTYTWMWIVLGIVLVIAAIWWAGDTGPTIPADTTGAGTVEAVQPAGTEQSGIQARAALRHRRRRQPTESGRYFT